jgi:acyl-CoA synthetase (AMP-forming)/AMP-acid ligase II/acetyltransferase-like isoleucine patch superfamily enzyme/acyl carrier protein
MIRPTHKPREISLESGNRQNGLSLYVPNRRALPHLRSTISEHPTTNPSTAPLRSLSRVITTHKHTNGLSTFQLIQEYTRCWKALPENVKSGQTREHDELLKACLASVKSSYTSLLDLLPSGSASPAIIDGISRKTLSQSRLAEFVRNFRIPVNFSSENRDAVAVGLPNGALLGLVSISVATHYVLAPIDSTSGAEQFKTDLLRTGAKVLLVSERDVSRLGVNEKWVFEYGIEVFIVKPEQDMTFTISALHNKHTKKLQPPSPNGPDDTCLILFTSGTSGNKKIVPFTLHSIISSVAFVGESWGLGINDTCLNMMPLNHIGGLARNLFAPILLGGSTILCPAFDANLFWDLVEEQNPTWYYASPSMHSIILEEATNRTGRPKPHKIRMVCNAAGGLLPSLANQLRTTFNCTVLPSYGMTECMPISTPPLSYNLDRPGTSGISTGPELAILDDSEQIMAPNLIGRVCVRGPPLFSGYLEDGALNTSAFTAKGWFDTGDLGYMDDDGYLYITGRSKEVINRGGELISPFEIEEAIAMQARQLESPIYGRVSECLAFSVPHAVLQEVVGVVLVTPQGQPRVDLRQLQDAVKTSLNSTKWPVTVVYMDALPKRNTKLCRVNLGHRLDFEVITEDMSLLQRHFEASCPHPNAAISTKIMKFSCEVEPDQTSRAISTIFQGQADVLTKLNVNNGLLESIIAPKSLHHQLKDINPESIKDQLRVSLDGYLVPGRISVNKDPLPRDASGAFDPLYLRTVFAKQARHRRMASEKGVSTTESRLCSIFATVLNIPREDIAKSSDFFELGGDSLRAGKLSSALRKEFKVSVSIDQLFKFSKVDEICGIIAKKQAQEGKERFEELPLAVLPGCNESYSSSRLSMRLVHLLPLGLISPLKQALFWVVFLSAWRVALKILGGSRPGSQILCLVFSMLGARITVAVCSPLTSILAKWIIIGRYREGLYPMWSFYHTRWWVVQKTTHICGLGMFKHFNWSRILFYRLMGAKIGKNVIIEPGTVLGEYDLLEIADNVELDRCVCRPFAAERNTTMYLGKIRLGFKSAAGLNTVIAPGTSLPPHTCLGMKSSSWEYNDASETKYDQLASRIPGPHWLPWTLFGLPLIFLIYALSLLPWLGGLYGLKPKDLPAGSDLTLFLVGWFAKPSRVGFHFLARILHLIFSPMVSLALVIALKSTMDRLYGKIKPSSTIRRRHIDRFRMALFNDLIPNGLLGEVTGFFGTHYEITSIIVRMLGGKVGKRVYWPGNGPSIQNFDLIDIGDDVIFGSRAQLITSDGIGCDYVRIGDGAMVADRVGVLPGTITGEAAVLGSGTLTQRNAIYASNSVHIGNKAGAPVSLSSGVSPIPSPPRTPTSPQLAAFDHEFFQSDESRSSSDMTAEFSLKSTYSKGSSNEGSFLPLLGQITSLDSFESSTPFGRAFYQYQAPYKVYGLFTISTYCILINILISVYWNAPTILTIQLLSKLSHDTWISPFLSKASSARPFAIFGILLTSFSILNLLFSFLSLAICIAAKWALLGRRTTGNYSWDKSPYCQRWQILLTIERIRGDQFGGEGILAMLTGTSYIATYFRLLGAKIGKDCALFAGGEMTLSFTEPDLLTLGDRVAVDDASLVAHINSRGTFDLNSLAVGDRSVLRTGSRLLSGAVMGNDTCLLEHTLVMAGDDVEDGSTCQGWPADAFTKSRVILEPPSQAVSVDKQQGNETKRSFSLRNMLWKRRHSVQYERIVEMTKNR